MKKICFVTTTSATLKSFVLNFAKYLHTHTDWEISFICDTDKEFASMLPAYIRYFPVSMKRGISLDGLKAIKEIEKICKREKFDLIQYSTPNAALYTSIASKRAKIPVRLYCQWGMAFVKFSGWRRKVFKTEEKLVCKNSTWIEPDSKSNLNFARNEKLYSADKSSVVWNGSACGVNLEKFDISKKSEYRKIIREKLNIPDDSLVYIFVGRVNVDKGINELLAAYKMIHKTTSSFLLIVGDSEVDSSVDMNLYEWSRDNEKIIYTGKVDNVEEYIAASDIYVLSSYREGFGLSVIEAQAMGIPVIVTDIPGPIDAMIVGKSGLTVPKQNVDELYSAMKKMYCDAELRKEFGKAGYENAKNNFEQNEMFRYILEDRKKLLGV